MRVTLTTREELGSLRRPEHLEVIKASISAANERFGVRIVAFGIEDASLSLVMEAPDKRSLSLGVQGLSIRVARGINRVLDRTGEVFSQRHHVEELTTEAEALVAVMTVHWMRVLRGDDPWNVDRFTSASEAARWHEGRMVVVRPRTALLSRAANPPG